MTSDQPAFDWDGGRRRLVWANEAGLSFWGAASAAELAARSFAADDPCALAMDARLAEITAGADQRGLITLRPTGAPVTAYVDAETQGPDDGLLRLSIVRLAAEPDSRSLRLSAAFDADKDAVALFDEGGALIARNLADRTLIASADPGFADRYVDAEAGRAALEAAFSDGVFEGQAELFTEAGPAMVAVSLRRLDDPVAGGFMALCSFAPVKDAQVDAGRIAPIAHDIRSPLNAIKGFAEFLELTGNDLDDRTRTEYLQNIQIASRRLLSVANRLTGRPEHAALESVDLAALAAEEAAFYQNMAGQHDVTLSLEEGPASVCGDPVSIRRILQNLIDNAIRHGGAGAAVAIRVDASGLTVSDNGPGLSEADLAAALEGRSGSGLKNCADLASEMGARMEFADQSDSGFAARLLFPV
ncbi:MAG: HAMP domain-containing sensor histidine kinase [Pseudomonadota bacterium]